MSNELSKFKNLIILGSSLTHSPWFTWKDFVEIESELDTYDLSSTGVGNEYMVHALMSSNVPLNENSIVLCMMTNFDKFDWYVTNNKYQQLQKEKHRPKKISNHSGFWCTGSWFPLDKQLYQTHFYDDDYFCTKTIQQILLLKNICGNNNSKLLLFFDSPVWSFTEKTINTITPDNQNTIEYLKKDFLSYPLSNYWSKNLDSSTLCIYDKSFLGFCWKNNLLWYNDKHKCHPPSSSHWEFYNSVIKPLLSQFIKIKNVNLTDKITKFDQEWKNC